MSPYQIPFNHSAVLGRELEYIGEALATGQIGGDQTFTRRCEDLLQRVLGVRRALLTTSCTHALELTGLLLGLGPGDEVVVPAYTFVSTANAYVVRGARTVFADVRPDTLNLDENRLEELITPRTRAIVVVHYAGVACEMDTILKIAGCHGVPVIEDNAHGLFGKYRGKMLGTLGCLSTQSFHETKNITCGEGGALLVNDATFRERAEIIREKGTDRSRFFRGLVDKYTWQDVGSSYVVSDVLAAFLFGQLELWETVQERRGQIWTAYDDALKDWAANRGIRTPRIPEECEQAYHMYYLVMNSEADRRSLISHLKERGIMAVFHYLPLNRSPMGLKLGGEKNPCPVAEGLSRRIVRLPFYNTMTQAQLQTVLSALHAWDPPAAI